jgi:hypothetical protein
MKTYAITFLLTTPTPDREEVESLAAELAEDAGQHLRDGEHLELEGVERRESAEPARWAATGD